MKFKRKILPEGKPKKGKSKRISLKAMEWWNKMTSKKSNKNKFSRKPTTRKLWIQCESIGGEEATEIFKKKIAGIYVKYGATYHKEYTICK